MPSNTPPPQWGTLVPPPPPRPCTPPRDSGSDSRQTAQPQWGTLVEPSPPPSPGPTAQLARGALARGSAPAPPSTFAAAVPVPLPSLVPPPAPALSPSPGRGRNSRHPSTPMAAPPLPPAPPAPGPRQAPAQAGNTAGPAPVGPGPGKTHSRPRPAPSAPPPPRGLSPTLTGPRIPGPAPSPPAAASPPTPPAPSTPPPAPSQVQTEEAPVPASRRPGRRSTPYARTARELEHARTDVYAGPRPRPFSTDASGSGGHGGINPRSEGWGSSTPPTATTASLLSRSRDVARDVGSAGGDVVPPPQSRSWAPVPDWAAPRGGSGDNGGYGGYGGVYECGYAQGVRGRHARGYPESGRVSTPAMGAPPSPLPPPPQPVIWAPAAFAIGHQGFCDMCGRRRVVVAMPLPGMSCGNCWVRGVGGRC